MSGAREGGLPPAGTYLCNGPAPFALRAPGLPGGRTALGKAFPDPLTRGDNTEPRCRLYRLYSHGRRAVPGGSHSSRRSSAGLQAAAAAKNETVSSLEQPALRKLR